MNGLMRLFTAGIGENSSYMRKVCADMDYLVFIWMKLKRVRSKELREINTTQSKTKILVIPTNEELEIAIQVQKLLLNNTLCFMT
jgi:acetate kinase